MVEAGSDVGPGRALDTRFLGKSPANCAQTGQSQSSEFANRTCAAARWARQNELQTSPTQEGGCVMAGTVNASLVHQFAAMKPAEFGATIEPKWQVADRLVKEVRSAVEKQQL